MKPARLGSCFLACAVISVCAVRLAGASEPDVEVARVAAAAAIPLERIAEPLRGHVDGVLQNATLHVRGPSETFPCRPGVYRWLLDHPDWGIACWKALANTPLSIDRQSDGSFVGKDNQGGLLRWQCILSEPGRRIWYAEGTGRLAPFLPVSSLKAVLCLRYQEVMGGDGRYGIRHRMEAFAVYDAKAAGWFSKLTGVTPDAAGKKLMEQVEIFFSGMAYYLSEHPDWGQQALQPRAAAVRNDAIRP
jgi:hypothetical protein